jgi:hypothetical protein
MGALVNAIPVKASPETAGAMPKIVSSRFQHRNEQLPLVRGTEARGSGAPVAQPAS